MLASELNMGDECKDKITGFKGIVTSVHNFIDGCTQVCLTPTVDKQGQIQDQFQCDVERIEVVHPLKAKILSTVSGGPSKSGKIESAR